jgi:hypothetical protein
MRCKWGWCFGLLSIWERCRCAASQAECEGARGSGAAAATQADGVGTVLHRVPRRLSPTWPCCCNPAADVDTPSSTLSVFHAHGDIKRPLPAWAGVFVLVRVFTDSNYPPRFFAPYGRRWNWRGPETSMLAGPADGLKRCVRRERAKCYDTVPRGVLTDCPPRSNLG